MSRRERKSDADARTTAMPASVSVEETGTDQQQKRQSTRGERKSSKSSNTSTCISTSTSKKKSKSKSTNAVLAEDYVTKPKHRRQNIEPASTDPIITTTTTASAPKEARRKSRSKSIAPLATPENSTKPKQRRKTSVEPTNTESIIITTTKTTIDAQEKTKKKTKRKSSKRQSVPQPPIDELDFPTTPARHSDEPHKEPARLGDQVRRGRVILELYETERNYHALLTEYADVFLTPLQAAATAIDTRISESCKRKSRRNKPNRNELTAPDDLRRLFMEKSDLVALSSIACQLASQSRQFLADLETELRSITKTIQAGGGTVLGLDEFLAGAGITTVPPRDMSQEEDEDEQVVDVVHVASLANVGRVVRRHVQLFRVYEQFAASYGFASRGIMELMMDTDFVQWWTNRSERPTISSTSASNSTSTSSPYIPSGAYRPSLEGYMILPIQRVPRYSLLLAQALTATPQSLESEVTQLRAASTEVESVAFHMNEAIRRSEHSQELERLQKRFIGGVVDLVGGLDGEKSRWLVRQGQLQRVVRKGVRRPFFFHLFNDTLLYSEQTPHGFKLHRALPIDNSFTVTRLPPGHADNLYETSSQTRHRRFSNTRHLQTERRRKTSDPTALVSAASDIGESDVHVGFGFQVNTPIKSFTVFADSDESLEGWLLDLGSVIAHRQDERANEKTGPLDAPAPVWQSESASSVCQVCTARFTLLRRRNHCRRCGILVCDSCSNRKRVIRSRVPKPLRVCDVCHLEMDATPVSTEPNSCRLALAVHDVTLIPLGTCIGPGDGIDHDGALPDRSSMSVSASSESKRMCKSLMRGITFWLTSPIASSTTEEENANCKQWIRGPSTVGLIQREACFDVSVNRGDEGTAQTAMLNCSSDGFGPVGSLHINIRELVQHRTLVNGNTLHHTRLLDGPALAGFAVAVTLVARMRAPPALWGKAGRANPARLPPPRMPLQDHNELNVDANADTEEPLMPRRLKLIISNTDECDFGSCPTSPNSLRPSMTPTSPSASSVGSGLFGMQFPAGAAAAHHALGFRERSASNLSGMSESPGGRANLFGRFASILSEESEAGYVPDDGNEERNQAGCREEEGENDLESVASERVVIEKWQSKVILLVHQRLGQFEHRPGKSSKSSSKSVAKSGLNLDLIREAIDVAFQDDSRQDGEEEDASSVLYAVLQAETLIAVALKRLTRNRSTRTNSAADTQILDWLRDQRATLREHADDLDVALQDQNARLAETVNKKTGTEQSVTEEKRRGSKVKRSSVNKKGETQPISKKSKSASPRATLIEELLTSERVHNKRLMLLQKAFVAPLLQVARGGSTVSSTTVHKSSTKRHNSKNIRVRSSRSKHRDNNVRINRRKHSYQDKGEENENVSEVSDVYSDSGEEDENDHRKMFGHGHIESVGGVRVHPHSRLRMRVEALSAAIQIKVPRSAARETKGIIALLRNPSVALVLQGVQQLITVHSDFITQLEDVVNSKNMDGLSVAFERLLNVFHTYDAFAANFAQASEILVPVFNAASPPRKSSSRRAQSLQPVPLGMRAKTASHELNSHNYGNGSKWRPLSKLRRQKTSPVGLTDGFMLEAGAELSRNSSTSTSSSAASASNIIAGRPSSSSTSSSSGMAASRALNELIVKLEAHPTRNSKRVRLVELLQVPLARTCEYDRVLRELMACSGKDNGDSGHLMKCLDALEERCQDASALLA